MKQKQNIQRQQHKIFRRSTDMPHERDNKFGNNNKEKRIYDKKRR